MKQLIVNADDFGMTSGINRAILEMHERGVLTSATLMANAPAADEAVHLASTATELGVGCHIVLVDGVPILPPDRIPSLVHRADGRFRNSLAHFAYDLAQDRIRPNEVCAEAVAQITHLQSMGLRLTHLDTHKHTHMFPRVQAPILEAAKLCGIRVIRNPFEQRWSISATPRSPLIRKFQVRVLNRFQSSFLELLDSAKRTTTDGAVGVLATGTLDTHTLHSLLAAMPDGTWELVTHPGYNDAQLATSGTRLLASREIELQALRDARIPSDVQLIHFGQLGEV